MMFVETRIWWGAVAAVWLTLLTIATAATAAERVSMHEWTTYKKHYHNYGKSGVDLKFQRHDDEDTYFIELTLSMRGEPSYNTSFKDGYDTPSVSYTVIQIDPSHSKRDVLVIRNLGNDCCSNPVVFSLIQGRWHKIDFGPNIDSASLEVEYVPQAKPNGRIVLRARDRRFYVLGEAHCCFDMPTRFLTVENGKILDISTDPAFAETFEKEVRVSKLQCQHSDVDRNSSCATYVAASARLGRFKEAWETMLKHYNREVDMEYSFCLAKEFSDDCGRWSPSTSSLPEILGPFLQARGYISHTELDSVWHIQEKP